MDVYLAGYADKEWRSEFMSSISNDIKVFDPMIQNYDELDEGEYADQVARELELAETSEVVVFYLDENWKSYFSMIQLGDTVGRGKQVVVCMPNDIESEAKIRRYCEYRGIGIADNLEDLVSSVEELLAETELCEVICSSEED